MPPRHSEPLYENWKQTMWAGLYESMVERKAGRKGMQCHCEAHVGYKSRSAHYKSARHISFVKEAARLNNPIPDDVLGQHKCELLLNDINTVRHLFDLDFFFIIFLTRSLTQIGELSQEVMGINKELAADNKSLRENIENMSELVKDLREENQDLHEENSDLLNENEAVQNRLENETTMVHQAFVDRYHRLTFNEFDECPVCWETITIDKGMKLGRYVYHVWF
tara:strand:+ start:73 stop:741 length:669 start_codon:yes stop_codon:yes gene_type:complete